MATYTFSEFHLDEAQLLVDLEGTRMDLQEARLYVDRILKAFGSGSWNDHLELESLCVTTIIKYGRAFVGGVRKIDKEKLTSNLPSEIEATHQKFLEWRNLHIAHSVNDFDLAKIQARYCAERVEEEGITGVSVSQSRVLTPSPSEFEALSNAIDYFLEALSRMIEAETSKVLEVIRAYPLETVLEMNEPAMRPGVDSRRRAKSRKRK